MGCRQTNGACKETEKRKPSFCLWMVILEWDRGGDCVPVPSRKADVRIKWMILGNVQECYKDTSRKPEQILEKFMFMTNGDFFQKKEEIG